jgi:AcrR family transcriptional regulator
MPASSSGLRGVLEMELVQKTRRPLTRARVLKAAMKVADREGLAALSMRRLGMEVGVEAMSLYHHLPGKEGLLDGLVEALMEEISAEVAVRPPALTADWKIDLRSRCLAGRQVVLRHPWMPALFATRKFVPGALYLYVEQILALLVGAGFSYQIAHRALHALGSLMFGFVQELLSPPASGGRLDAAQAEAEFARMASVLPHLCAMISSEVHEAGDPTIGWCDSQTEFEFTLDLLLDGLGRLRVNPGHSAK